jgi:type I restriction enzyme M protein
MQSNKLTMPRFKDVFGELGSKTYEFYLMLIVYLIKKNKDTDKAFDLSRLFAQGKFYLNKTDLDQETKAFISIELDTIAKRINIDKANSNTLKKLSESSLELLLKMNLIELESKLIKIDDNNYSVINHLALKLLENKNNDEFLDICSGKGDFLTLVSSKHPKSNLYGQEINKENVLISRIRLYLSNAPKYKIINGDVMKEIQFKKNFNSIFLYSPLQTKNWFSYDIYFDNKNFNNKFDFNKSITNQSSDWNFIIKAFEKLTDNGKMVAVISDGALAKLTDKTIRQNFVDNLYIESVITLPDTNEEASNLNISLIVLSKKPNKKIYFSDLRNKVVKKDKQFFLELAEKIKLKSKEYGVDVNYKDIVKNEYSLMVSQYTNSKLLDESSFALKEKILDSFRGYQFSISKENSSKSVYKYNLLKLSDLDDGIIYKELETVETNKNLDRYLIKYKDILISSKNTKIKIAYVDYETTKTIASGSIIVLRLDPRLVKPEYVFAFLNSKQGEIALSNLNTGSKIFTLNPSQLNKLLVPKANHNKQDKIEKNVIDILEQIRMNRKKLDILRSNLEDLSKE